MRGRLVERRPRCVCSLSPDLRHAAAFIRWLFVRFQPFARLYAVSAVRPRKPAVLHSGHAPLPVEQPSEFRDRLFGGSSLVFGVGGLYRRSAARPVAFLPQQSVRPRSGIVVRRLCYSVCFACPLCRTGYSRRVWRRQERTFRSGRGRLPESVGFFVMTYPAAGRIRQRSRIFPLLPAVGHLPVGR